MSELHAVPDNSPAPAEGEGQGQGVSARPPRRVRPPERSADRPYRIFVENMRDGAATVSEGGIIPVRVSTSTLDMQYTAEVPRDLGVTHAQGYLYGPPDTITDRQLPNAHAPRAHQALMSPTRNETVSQRQSLLG